MNDAIALAEWDWLVLRRGTTLHHAALSVEDAEELVNIAQLEDVTLTCGRTVHHAHIPGVFTRMSMRRCSACCKRLGYPQGKGSPKNDEACRPLVEARLEAA